MDHPRPRAPTLFTLDNLFPARGAGVVALVAATAPADGVVENAGGR